jgi:hypothetical protein
MVGKLVLTEEEGKNLRGIDGKERGICLGGMG